LIGLGSPRTKPAAWPAVLSLADPALRRETYLTYGFVPAQFNIAALPTSMFLHAGLSHLAGNFYFLVVFRRLPPHRALPDRRSDARLGHWAVYPDSTLPLIEDSGAIAALMGAVAVGFPTVRVNLLGFFGLFLAVTVSSVADFAGGV
jgi:membrane associated rhomboid family serine protease